MKRRRSRGRVPARSPTRAVPFGEIEPDRLPTSRTLLRRILGLLGVAAVLVLVVGALPGLADVRGRFGRADPSWLAAMFACTFASMLSYVAAVRGTLSQAIGWRASWNLGMAEQGSNVLLPTGGVGGPALGAMVLRRAGFPIEFAAPRSASLFLLTSATSFAAIALAGIATGVGVLPGGSSWVDTLLPAALAIAVVAAVVALGHLPTDQPSTARRRPARWGHRIAGLLREGVAESLTLLRQRNVLVVVGCVGYLVFSIAGVGAAFAAFGGGGPPIGAFVLAYTLGQVGALLPTPGGLGGTESGLIGMFVLYGAPTAPTAAAILGYRVVQLALPTILGLIAFRQIRRRLLDDELTAAVAARFSHESVS